MDEKACAGDEVLAEIPEFSQLYASLRFCVEPGVKFCGENPVGANENACDEVVVGADDKTNAEIRACAGLNDKSRAKSNDDNFPIELPAPPLLHGSHAVHGSMPLEFTEVPAENWPEFSSADGVGSGRDRPGSMPSGSLFAR